VVYRYSLCLLFLHVAFLASAFDCGSNPQRPVSASQKRRPVVASPPLPPLHFPPTASPPLISQTTSPPSSRCTPNAICLRVPPPPRTSSTATCSHRRDLCRANGTNTYKVSRGTTRGGRLGKGRVGGRTWQSWGAKAIQPMPSPLPSVAASPLAASVPTDLASPVAYAQACSPTWGRGSRMNSTMGFSSKLSQIPHLMLISVEDEARILECYWNQDTSLQTIPIPGKFLILFSLCLLILHLLHGSWHQSKWRAGAAFLRMC
jgi:hypothetical protein